MLNFNNTSKIVIGGKEAKKIEINNTVVWEKLEIVLTSSINSSTSGGITVQDVNEWGNPVTLYAKVKHAPNNVEGLTVNFSNGLTAVTNKDGVAMISVNSQIATTINFYAFIGDVTSNSISVSWDRKDRANIIVTPLHQGTLYYGHSLKFKITNADGSSCAGDTAFIFDSYDGVTHNITVDENSCVTLPLTRGSKTSTTKVEYTAVCGFLNDDQYSGIAYSFNYSYQPSIKYNASLSSAASDSYCTATFSGSKTYGRWYATSTDYTMAEALKGTGTVRAYLASASGSTSCKTPEELAVKTNGKNGTTTVSGTVLAIGYYIGAKRASTVSTKFNNIKIQLYSNGEWVSKATASRTTTLPTDYPDPYYTGTFSWVPTMAQLTSGYVRLVAYFTANTKSDIGYVYIGEFYPQVWYAPPQTFIS